jgi:endonuclease YncB( thermonuclease family)
MFRAACVALILLAAPAAAGERLAGRAHVTDGDTISVGVAASEVGHLGDRGEPGVEAAEAFMVVLVEGQTVVCDFTAERSHGRRLGTCFRQEKTSPTR